MELPFAESWKIKMVTDNRFMTFCKKMSGRITSTGHHLNKLGRVYSFLLSLKEFG